MGIFSKIRKDPVTRKSNDNRFPMDHMIGCISFAILA
jgi:hypothetical protein